MPRGRQRKPVGILSTCPPAQWRALGDTILGSSPAGRRQVETQTCRAPNLDAARWL